MIIIMDIIVVTSVLVSVLPWLRDCHIVLPILHWPLSSHVQVIIIIILLLMVGRLGVVSESKMKMKATFIPMIIIIIT